LLKFSDTIEPTYQNTIYASFRETSSALSSDAAPFIVKRRWGEQQMTRSWRLFFFGWLIIAIGVLTAHLVQTSGGVSVKEVRYSTDDGRTISALLYTPKMATATSPAPGILAVHGYINSREVQSGFAIEFARRGYVVLTPDQTGHGYSDAPAFANGFGGPASLAYLRSLEIVDLDNIGLEGHSMGGWAVLAAAAALPEGYRSMVLEGSSTGAPFAMDGTPDWPRNTAVVFSKFDEFSSFMWGVDRASDITESPKLRALFNSVDQIKECKIYGDTAAGTARALYQPAVTHPGDHISPVAIGHAIDWFAETLDGGMRLPSDSQIWVWKEAGTLTALVGFIVLLMGTFQILLETPYFSRLKTKTPSGAFERRTPGWWTTAAISMILPVSTFYLFFKWAEALLPASALLPQTITTQIVFWAVLNGCIAALIGLTSRPNVETRKHDVIAAVLIAIPTVAIGYVAVWLAGTIFHIDFRFWFIGVKVLSLAQAQIAVAYALPLGVYFILASKAIHQGLSLKGDSSGLQYASNAAIMAGGFAIFLGAQYLALFSTGKLLTPSEPLNTIIMLQFVPLMLIVSLLGTFTYRRTASYIPGAAINTLFVTWYIVAGQATQFVGS
jgi:pimeloyl-ACP methyl ester carboxylesterase/uncharacterized membrane protein